MKLAHLAFSFRSRVWRADICLVSIRDYCNSSTLAWIRSLPLSFVVFCDALDVVRVLLVHAGIECASFYSSPCHLNSGLRLVSYSRSSSLIAEIACVRLLGSRIGSVLMMRILAKWLLFCQSR